MDVLQFSSLCAVLWSVLVSVLCVVVFDEKPCRSDCITTAMFEEHKQDYSLVDHVIKRLQVQSPLDCMRHCLREPRCESINCEYVIKPLIQCELNHVTKDTKPLYYVQRTGYSNHDAMGSGDGWCKSVCPSPEKSAICPSGFAGLDCSNAMTSCKDWKDHGFTQDGVYFLSITNHNTLPVYCDQTTDGGGWTVFQRRHDGSVNFYRNWNDYKNGFGSLSEEFWLGNDVIHALTSYGVELRVELESFSGAKAYAKYLNFTLSGEEANYTLFVAGFSGTAGDSLGTGSPLPKVVSSGMAFSTFDRDHDRHSHGGACAVDKRGAWWFNDCYWSHLDGPYKKEGQSDGIDWFAWSAVNYKTLKKTEMKMRPRT